jgi:hypothetical protein
LTLDRENYPLSLGTLFKLKTKSKKNYKLQQTKNQKQKQLGCSRKVLSL